LALNARVYWGSGLLFCLSVQASARI